MKIAQIAPIWFSVPPSKYGGAEIVIANLINGLVTKRHDVTLYGSGDSTVNVEKISVIKKAPCHIDWLNYGSKEFMNVARAIEESDLYDILHFHITVDLSPLILSQFSKKPTIITFHNFLKGHESKDIYLKYKDSNCVAISSAFKNQFPSMNFIGVVYNGIEINNLPFSSGGGNYISWIGRFNKIKASHLVIDVAQELKILAKIAAPLPYALEQTEYFEKEIKDRLKSKYVSYVGEVGINAKSDLLRNSRVFVNPIQHEEPFGLVVPEANACGTPVVAFARGSMPEIIKDGINGFLVKPNDLKEMTKVVKAIFDMPESQYLKLRENCRKHVEDNFTVEKMADGYEKVYKKILTDRKGE